MPCLSGSEAGKWEGMEKEKRRMSASLSWQWICDLLAATWSADIRSVWARRMMMLVKGESWRRYSISTGRRPESIISTPVLDVKTADSAYDSKPDKTQRQPGRRPHHREGS